MASHSALCCGALLLTYLFKLNWNRIAELFGQGTTGNAIECNFRKIRAASKGIKQEWEARNAGGAPPTPTQAAAPKTPKTPADEGIDFFESAFSQGEQPIRVYELLLDPDGGPNKDRAVECLFSCSPAIEIAPE